MNFKNKTGISLAIPTNKLGGKMSKAVLMSGLTAALVMTVLVGCGGDKKVTKDVYYPPFKVLVGEKSFDFKIWELETTRKLDINDSFDFSESSVAKAIFDGKCSLGSEIIKHKIELPDLKLLNVVTLIPKDFLGQQFNKTNLHCSYHVTLFNKAGSQHIFDIAAYEVGDSSESKVSIETESSTSKKSSDGLSLLYSDNRTMFRFRNASDATSELSCADFTFEPQPFDHFIDLIRFDQKTALLRAGRDPEVLVNTGFMQTCRLLISEKGFVVATSPLFELKLPGAAFSVNSLTSEFEGKSLEDTGSVFTGWQTHFTISSYEVRNDWTEPRIAVIPVRSFSIRTYSYIREAFHREGGWGYTEIDLKGITTYTQSDTEWRVVMKPGASLTVSQIFDTPETPFCISANQKFLGIGIFPLGVGESSIKELKISGELVKEWPINFGKPLVITTKEYPEWGPGEVRRMPEVPCGG